MQAFPQKPMTLMTLWQRSLHLWFETLPAVIIFNLMVALFKSLPFFSHVHSALFSVMKNSQASQFLFDKKDFLLYGLVDVLNLIPSNAIWAYFIYFLMQKKIKTSQALAISFLRFPKTLLWLGVNILILMLMGYSFIYLKINNFLFFLMIVFNVIFTVYSILTPLFIIYKNDTVFNAFKKSIQHVQGQGGYTAIAMGVPLFFLSILTALVQKNLGPVTEVVLITTVFHSMILAFVMMLYIHHRCRHTINVTKNK